MKSIDRDYQFFLNHRDRLCKEYYSRFVVIKDEEVVSDHSSEIEAYLTAKEKYGLGNFIIQYCVPEEEEQQQVYHSPIVEI